MSWEVPAGGVGSAGFTNTGLGYDGTNLLIGDFTNSRIVKTTLAGAYVAEIVLASSPASSVQGVAYDTSDGTYWVCHYDVSTGTVRQYNSSGSLLNTITPSVGTPGPNGCIYDAVNDRILTMWPDNVVRGYSCATLSSTPVETITLSGFAGTFADGIAFDPTDPTTRLWVTMDGSSTTEVSRINKINRSSGASVLEYVCPAGQVEGLAFVGAVLYVCCDQDYHLAVPNGNRVWQLDPLTGFEVTGVQSVAKSASFTLVTSSGAQVVTGLGFTPKALIFFGCFSGAGATECDTFGVCDPTFGQWSMSSRSNDGVTPTVAERSWDSSYCIATTDGAGAYGPRATAFTMTHDGFVLNVTTAGGTRRFHVLAIGGDDVDVKAGSFTLTTAAGTNAVTGVGFTPKAVLFSANQSNTTNGVAADSRFAVGAMTAVNQWGVTAYGWNAQATSDEQGVALTDSAILRISDALAITAKAGYSSLDADGFTVTKSTSPGANVNVGYLALGGAVTYKVGTFNQPTSTGNQAVTGVGFQPIAELFVSSGRVTSASVTAASRVMVGAATSSTDRRAYAGTAQNGVNPSNTARDMDEAAALIAIGDGGTPTRSATADFVSQDADGFTVNWSAADATARQNFYLAVSSAPATVPDAPTIGTASATGSTTASVSYIAPIVDGGSTITSYVATSTPGSITGTLSQAGSGTISVTGLSASTAYTFTVRAVNGIGNSAESAASNSITTDAAPAVATTASVSLVSSAGAVSGGLSGLKWAFFDQATPNLFVAPVAKGSAESTDGNGMLTVGITGTALAPGAVGWLVVTSSDGTPGQSPSGKKWAGPVTVA